MIRIQDLRQEDVGRKVVYRAAPEFKPQSGVISSWNNRFVFVRYNQSVTAQATNPNDLEWEFKSEF